MLAMAMKTATMAGVANFQLNLQFRSRLLPFATALHFHRFSGPSVEGEAAEASMAVAAEAHGETSKEEGVEIAAALSLS